MSQPVDSARTWVLGLNRSFVLRRLVRLGGPRLRELREAARGGSGLRALSLRAGLGLIEHGILRVPRGQGAGLVLDMRYLPITHAHAGLLAEGNLESAVQEAMVRHLGSGGVFYDIGANIGFFALVGARLVGSDGIVYAFDAAPDNAEAIRTNAQLNGCRNVEVIAKAVSSQGGRVRLQVVEDQSWSKLEGYGEHPDTVNVIEVEAVTIDALLDEGALRPPTMVKIDVEGAEMAVLEGMRRTLQEHRPAIICELHGTHARFVEFMDAVGYRLINLEGTIPVREEGASAHALALPPLDSGD